MGGGEHFPYPKWVWTPTGGWWPVSRFPRRNALIGTVISAVVWIGGFRLSGEMERRVTYPTKWDIGMLYGKDFHDPTYVAFWKAHLAETGQEWIEPIPTWWPSWIPPFRKDDK